MTRRFFGKDELRGFRQQYVLRYDELTRRQSAEWDALRSEVEDALLADHDLTVEEVREEWLAIVEEATPLSNEYDLTGLQEIDEDV